MAIEKKLIHFSKLSDFETQLNAGNILDYSIVFIQDAKKIWTHSQYYDCNGGNGTSDSPTFLRIGDADDEAKANFIAVVNGEKSADYYICASSIQGVEANGIVSSLTYVGPSVAPISVRYTFYGSTMSGATAYKLLKINTELTLSDNTITTTYEAVLDDKQDTLISGTNIKTINGETVLGSGDLQIPTGDNNVQVDWNVNDTTSDSYIKNRTHYAEFSQVSIPLTINTDSWTQIQLSGITGQILYVRYSYSPSNIVAAVTFSMNDLNVERTLNRGPIFTIYRTTDSIFLKGKYDENHILEVATIVNKLPDYFIPSNIARTSELSGKQDTLVSGTNIKTINGQSLLGSGDITISGGSSSGSSAYTEVSHGTSDTTFTLTPNTFHVWDEVSSLTLTLGTETSGVANEYIFQFTSGSTATTLSLPDDIKWTGGETPTIEANKIYQISILKGLGSVMEWDAVTSIFPANLVVGDNGELGVNVYNYLYSIYGESTVSITEELYCSAWIENMPITSIQYGTYEGETGYWLNKYNLGNNNLVLRSDGIVVRKYPQ